MTTTARELVLEQSARALSVAKDRRLPQTVRDEAGEIASELVSTASQIGIELRRKPLSRWRRTGRSL